MTARKRLTKSTDKVNGSEVHEDVRIGSDEDAPDDTPTAEQDRLDKTVRGLDTQNMSDDEVQEARDNLSQFPALRGNPELEVEKRQQPDNASGTHYTKVMRVGLTDAEVENAVADEEWLESQHNAVRAEALDAGLRATGDVEYVGVEKVGKNTHDVTFQVPVVPAVTAEGAVAMSPADEERAHEVMKDAEGTEK